VRAAVYHGPRDVRIAEVAAPGAPGPGELRLDVLRAGICGSDSSEYAHGPILVSLDAPHPGSGEQGPVTLGHEFVGRVTAVAADVRGFSVGDRVVSGARVECGTCAWCLEGRTNLCERSYIVGFHSDGGLAEQVLVAARSCAVVPAGCADDSAAMAQPLGIALHGLARAGATAGEGAAVFGIGGIGSFVLVGMRALGMDPIIAIDVTDEKLRLGTALGATSVINVNGADAVATIRQLSGGDGVPLVVEASGAPAATGQAIQAARSGGRVLQLGMPTAPRPLDLTGALLREISLITSCALINEVDLPKALSILTETDAAAIIHDRTVLLERLVEDGLTRLLAGQATGKILVDPRPQD
jgi:threonine dehydrogenase-like Zn-dependent dehydrogenase